MWLTRVRPGLEKIECPRGYGPIVETGGGGGFSVKPRYGWVEIEANCGETPGSVLYILRLSPNRSAHIKKKNEEDRYPKHLVRFPCFASVNFRNEYFAPG